jgi:pyruvate/2-oxoacid:ferredoxin oxidoreductase beta subunit
MSETPPTLLETYFVDHPRFPFCKGCSHTTVLRRLNEALVALQIHPEDVVLVTDIGCIGLADALFKRIHTVHTTHGRSTAFATGIALADSVLAEKRLKPIVLIGDGGAMIGLQHLVHAAMLNIDVTVLICNNFVYGMTGGQGSGLTPECFVTATTPGGNIVPPADVCEILRNSNAPFVARTIATDQGLPNILKEAIRFPGFAAVEILELCTEFAVPQNQLTGKKLHDIAEQHGWKLGSINDTIKRRSFAERYRENGRTKPSMVRPEEKARPRQKPSLDRPISIIVAGSAGERVQSAALGICQAAVDSGLEVTQKNDNPVTQGSGFSLVELWLSPQEIGYTGIDNPDIVVATSEEGLNELHSRGLFKSIKPETRIFLDESLSLDPTIKGVCKAPFRKTFGAESAALAALVFVAKKQKIIPEGVLGNLLSRRLGTSSLSFLAKLDNLNCSQF